MDAHWFLSQRVSFIRQLYLHATAPFVELQRVIETCETPLAPPYSEDGTPLPAFKFGTFAPPARIWGAT